MARMAVMLRGINVGGRHKLAMADLRTLLSDEGFDDVSTYVQSGNVVLSTSLSATVLAPRLASAIEAQFGFAVPVAVRTASQLEAVLARDPLAGAADDPKRYVVTFLAAEPAAAAVQTLQELAVDDERLHAHGRELYTHHPQGQARSKLAAALTGAAFGPSATARNWSTVTRLAQMARG